MKIDLSHKATDEKYYKSIRYFSHFLKGEKRNQFIIELSEHNIYLAAQCMMSAEKNVELEELLISKAETFARDFKNTEKSANAFLALAEFESYEIISSLLIDVKKPSNVHLNVFTKILEDNKLDVFISFIKILLRVNKVPFIQYLVNSFNGQVVITTENRTTFNSLLNYLFLNGNYGLARIMLEKYNLFDEIELIIQTKTTNVINKLIVAGKKKLTATKLAYEITKRCNLFNEFPPSKFILLALTKGGKSNKIALVSLGIAVEQKQFNIPELDQRITNLLYQASKKSKNKINQLIKKGLSFYIDNNPSLKNLLSQYQQGQLPQQHITFEPVKKSKPKKKALPEEIIIKDDVKIDEKIIPMFGTKPDKNFDISFYWSNYFNLKNSANQPTIQSLFTFCITNIEEDLRKVCAVVKTFVHSGIVKWNTEYGFYVSPLSFRTQSLLFLHQNQLKTSDNQLNVEDEIEFRVFGFNKKTERVMITMLNDIEIEEQIKNQNKVSTKSEQS